MAKVPIGKTPFGSIDLTDLPDLYTQDAPMQYINDSTTTAGVTYFCESPAGIGTDKAGWRIAKYTQADGTFKYADGNTKYDNIADNRASLTYAFTPV